MVYLKLPTLWFVGFSGIAQSQFCVVFIGFIKGTGKKASGVCWYSK